MKLKLIIYFQNVYNASYVSILIRTFTEDELFAITYLSNYQNQTLTRSEDCRVIWIGFLTPKFSRSVIVKHGY